MEFYAKAQKYPGYKGYREAEIGNDFASWATIKFIEGRKANINQLFIDYLREHYGDTRSSVGNERSKSNWNIKDHGEYDFSLGVNDKSKSSIGQILDDEFKLNQIDRACLILRFKWGFETHEIAELFQVSSSRISQRVNKIKPIKSNKSLDIGKYMNEDNLPSLLSIETKSIIDRLKIFNWNRTKTAKSLDISIRTLRNKLRIYKQNGIEILDFKINIKE